MAEEIGGSNKMSNDWIPAVKRGDVLRSTKSTKIMILRGVAQSRSIIIRNVAEKFNFGAIFDGRDEWTNPA